VDNAQQPVPTRTWGGRGVGQQPPNLHLMKKLQKQLWDKILRIQHLLAQKQSGLTAAQTASLKTTNRRKRQLKIAIRKI